MKEIRKIVRTVMNCLESGGFDDVQAKIAEHLGAPVDGYTIVIVAGDYDCELVGGEADGINGHEWIESIRTCGWEPDAEQIQQARQEAQSSALTYGEGPACFCATIEDERDYYLIIGLKVIGPDAEAGRLELDSDQVVAYLDSVFEGINSNADEGEEDEYGDDAYGDDDYGDDAYGDDDYEEDDYFRGDVEVYKFSGDPISAGDSEGEEYDPEEEDSEGSED